MGSLKDLRVDPERSQGVWFCAETLDPTPLAAPHEKLLCVKVARWNNPAQRAREAELFEIRAKDLRTNFAETRTEIQDRVIAECILVGWCNVDEGAYSKTLSYDLISDPSYDRFRQFVVQCSVQSEAYRLEAEEAVLKN